MLKDLAIEIAVLAGLTFSLFLLVPTIRAAYGIIHGFFVLPLLAFLGILCLAVFQVKRLSNGGKTKHAAAFTAILIANIIITSVITWILYEPQLV
jgi:hypothetical protein